MTTISLSLNDGSIAGAIRQLEEYRDRLEELCDRVAQRLAKMGYEVAYEVLSVPVYTGMTVDNLEVAQVGEGKYVLTTTSYAIMYLEFGAGVRAGGGHPGFPNSDFTPAPVGTYGEGHGSNPGGWWYPTDDPNLILRMGANGQGYGHTYGQPDYRPFWLADQEMRDNILTIAKEELLNDRH